MNFRDSHKLTGEIVKLAEMKKLPLEKLSLKELKKFNSKITDRLYDAIDLKNSIDNKKSVGGTSTANVQREIELAKEKMVKIIFSLTLFFFIVSCGKRGDIPALKTKDLNQPARIDTESDL